MGGMDERGRDLARGGAWKRGGYLCGFRVLCGLSRFLCGFRVLCG